MSVSSNVLMCVEVGMRLPHPRQHAYLRCAGSVGYNAFEELVASQRHIASYIEVSTSDYIIKNNQHHIRHHHHLQPCISFSPPLSAEDHDDDLSTVTTTTNVTILHVPFTDIKTGYLKTTHHSKLPPTAIMVYNHNVGKPTYRETPWQPSFQFDVRYEWDMELDTIPLAFPMAFAGLRELVTGRVEITQTENVKNIAGLFMHSCLNLHTLILHDLQNLTTIQPEFMMGCRSLTTIELPELFRVESIGNSFMANCSSLKYINLESLTSIDIIGTHFMTGCTALEDIILPTSLKHLTYMGGHFMFNCTNLKTIKLLELVKLRVYIGSSCGVVLVLSPLL